MKGLTMLVSPFCVLCMSVDVYYLVAFFFPVDCWFAEQLDDGGQY